MTAQRGNLPARHRKDVEVNQRIVRQSGQIANLPIASKGRDQFAMINERSIPDASQPGTPSKLVPFPVTPATKHEPRFSKYWLIAGLPSLLIVAIAAVT